MKQSAAKPEKETKRCTRCRKVQPIDEFGIRNEVPCGTVSHCKTCRAERHKDTYIPKPKRTRMPYNPVINGQRECKVCGELKDLSLFVKDKKADEGYRNTCKKCNQAHTRQRRAADPEGYYKSVNKAMKKYRSTVKGGIYQRFMSAKMRAKDKDLAFDIDVEYLTELFALQDGKCALTQAPLHLQGSWWDTASLDRMTPSLGYIRGNVQFLTNRANSMKSNMDMKEFIGCITSIVSNLEGSTTISKESTSQANGDGSA